MRALLRAFRHDLAHEAAALRQSREALDPHPAAWDVGLDVEAEQSFFRHGISPDALRKLLTGRPIETEVGELRIGVSIGVAFMRAGAGLSDEELLTSADEALASARAAGGNRIAFDRAHGLIRLEERRAEDAGA